MASSPESEDRRNSVRLKGSGLVCLSLEGAAAKAELKDHSHGGLRIRTRADLTVGGILYCAVPSLAVCTRARVTHVRRGLFTTTAGLEYLATLSDFS